MTAIKVSISIPEHMQHFLDENPSLSLSKLTQAKVQEVMDNIKHNPQLIEALQTIQKLQKVNKMLQEELQKANEHN